MSEESEVDETSRSSSSSSSDDDEVADINEKDFLKTLSCLKNKDPQIYDKNVQFFSQDEVIVKKKDRSQKKPSEKAVYIKDYIQDYSDEETDSEPAPLTYNEEQKAIKESFKKFVNEESSDDEVNDTLLKKKEKGEKEKQEEEEDYIQWLKGKKDDLNDKEVEQELKPLHEFWNNPDLDEKEGFLKDYILNKRYLERDSDGNFEDSDLSEDEKLLEAQDNFEQNYNFRFENEDKNIKRYPRKIEGSMRKKNDTRKRKREEIQKRKKEEKEKKKLEIKKKQKEKLLEVQDKIKKLKEITGNAELGFGDDEIMEDFDPDKYDKKMQELYNDKFYSEEIEAKPDFSNFDVDDDNWNLDEINMDCEAEESPQVAKESRSKRKRKKRKSSAYTDICDIVKPVFDPEKHSSYQKYIDEFYNLDCEDFIDDIPCRFKYREVVPNDYGLSVEEILMADDKELNRWASTKKICKLRPTHVEKNEVKIYKQKARDEELKGKLLPSLYRNDEEEEEYEDKSLEVDEHSNTRLDNSANEEYEEKKLLKNKLMHKQKRLPQQNIKVKNQVQSTTKKKSKFKKQEYPDAANPDPITKISDNRLLAYNIKPKQFRSKLKYSKCKE